MRLEYFKIVVESGESSHLPKRLCSGQGHPAMIDTDAQNLELIADLTAEYSTGNSNSVRNVQNLRGTSSKSALFSFRNEPSDKLFRAV